MHNPRLIVPKKPKGASEPERAIRQLVKLFARLRHTVPFPVPMMDVYAPLLPDIKLKQVLVGGESAAIPYQNLRLSIMWGHVVHVSLDEYEDYLKGISGEKQYDRVFHMVFKDEVIVPDAMTHPFRMDREHPLWADVEDWVTRAADLDGENDHLLGKLSSYLKRTGTAASIRQTWPELLNYVKLQGPTMAHVPRDLIRNVKEQSSILTKPKLRQAVLDKLAAATLLSNDNEPAAWVSFKAVTA
jgi:hypothetical protein